MVILTCTECGGEFPKRRGPTVERCPPCNAAHREAYRLVYYAQRRQAAKAAGLCPRCNKRKPQPLRVQCLRCTIQCNVACADRYNRLKGKGRCGHCGNKYAACACRQPALERNRRRRAKARAAGLCATCGWRKPVFGYAECAECRQRNAARYRAKAPEINARKKAKRQQAKEGR